MSEMAERVAEAMEAKRRDLIAQPLARIWPELALVAIESMRNASYDMRFCDKGAEFGLWPEQVRELWYAMIDAALQEKDT